MNKKMTLSIKNPCSENFSKFAQTDRGGYCMSCEKTVIDFRKMNDAEILNYFNIQKTKTCGLFLESQLKTYSDVSLLIDKQKSNKFVTSIFGFSLFSILSFTNAYSQEKTKENEIVKIEKNKDEQDKDSLVANQLAIIKGIVSDSTGPLPSANVVLKGTKIFTQADLDGKFTFPKRLKAGDILVVSFIGLKDQEIVVRKKNMEVTLEYDIKLKQETCIMMGEVNTNKVYKSKQTFFQKVKSLFTNE